MSKTLEIPISLLFFKRIIRHQNHLLNSYLKSSSRSCSSLVLSAPPTSAHCLCISSQKLPAVNSRSCSQALKEDLGRTRKTPMLTMLSLASLPYQSPPSLLISKESCLQYLQLGLVIDRNIFVHFSSLKFLRNCLLYLYQCTS